MLRPKSAASLPAPAVEGPFYEPFGLEPLDARRSPRDPGPLVRDLDLYGQSELYDLARTEALATSRSPHKRAPALADLRTSASAPNLATTKRSVPAEAYAYRLRDADETGGSGYTWLNSSTAVTPDGRVMSLASFALTQSTLGQDKEVHEEVLERVRPPPSPFRPQIHHEIAEKRPKQRGALRPSTVSPLMGDVYTLSRAMERVSDRVARGVGRGGRPLQPEAKQFLGELERFIRPKPPPPAKGTRSTPLRDLDVFDLPAERMHDGLARYPLSSLSPSTSFDRGTDRLASPAAARRMRKHHAGGLALARHERWDQRPPTPVAGTRVC